MIGIYAIRNKVNGKVYVGQSRNIQKRFKQHLDALERGVHHSKKLQKDFDELGADKFVLEFLEFCTSDQLDQKEMEWIAKFDSIRNGYNVQDPQTRNGWFFFRREKRPRFTIRGELARIFREILISLIEDFDNWRKKDRQTIKNLVKGMLVGLTVVLVFLIGGLIGWLTDGYGIPFYIAFLFISFVIFGMLSSDSRT